MTIFLGTRIPYQNMNCHPDRSAAKWRDLRFSPPANGCSMEAPPSPLSSRELVTFLLERQFFLGTRIPYQNMNCHPDRSVAKWRDLLFSPPASKANGSAALPFVIPSEAEGSAVLQAHPGNVFLG